ncbi:MAG: hypothetical protein RR277_04830 [Rikenellaceae bacterium]
MKSVLLFVLALISLTAHSESFSKDSLEVAQDRKHKTTYKFGGMVDARVMFDSYNSKSSRGGVVYFYPLAPSYDPSGADLNREGQLHFSVFSSRLNFSIDKFKVLGADANAFIEGDFLGSTDNYLQMLRLRYAYINLVWKTNKLLIGQTTNLNSVDELLANVIDIAGGLPFNPLNRGAQIRYEHLFSKSMILRASAEIYEQHRSVGPDDAQFRAALPDLNLQMVFGDNSAHKVLGGFTVGTKFLQPRSVDNLGYKIDRIITSYNVSAFMKFYAGDYKFQLWGIYGGNITPLGAIGGYGKVASQNVDGDYDLADVYTLSSWFDFETPMFNKFQFGLFAGYQRNMGSNVPLDMSCDQNGEYLYGYYRDCNLQWLGRLSPRACYYASDRFIFGLEYGYNVASWAKSVDHYFKATEKYNNTVNHRVILMARFIF